MVFTIVFCIRIVSYYGTYFCKFTGLNRMYRIVCNISKILKFLMLSGNAMFMETSNPN